MDYFTLGRTFPREKLREGYFRNPVKHLVPPSPAYVRPDVYCVEAVSSVLATTVVASISSTTFVLGVCCET
jgi:hypothetical protein